MTKYFLLIVCCIFAASVFATDHVDSPFEEDLAAADITDLFAFPRKENGKTTLVLAMTVHLSAKPESKFAEMIEYSFRLRRVGMNGFGKDFAVTSGEEFVVKCNFLNNSSGGQDVNCVVVRTSPQQEISKANTTVNDLSGGDNPALRLFAGHRADPFFFDPIRVQQSRLRTVSYDDIGFPFPGIIPKNALAYSNVLAIVVELDVNQLFGKNANPMFGIAGHTERVTFQGTKKVMLSVDRVGRPEVTNFIMGQFSISNPDLNAVKKQWNAEANSFSLTKSKSGLYRKTIEEGLASMDLKDTGLSSNGKDWPSPHPLTDIFMNDFLIVDTSKQGDVNSSNYFEIELSRYENRGHKSCGGRTPNEDFVDTMLTLLINGPDRKKPHRGDGIKGQPRPATNTFPYLGTHE
ncbi:DUF4331 family protein [Candidatus Uabimicrobium sp. HlEnr_7]|uniref:DUF4331 family protein n=1 Tax=Candidatus Uabimicrobium helgolandensis TaxID=3095367 RepID=UPI003557A4C0